MKYEIINPNEGIATRGNSWCPNPICNNNSCHNAFCIGNTICIANLLCACTNPNPSCPSPAQIGACGARSY